MVNYACAVSQSELGKYFERIIKYSTLGVGAYSRLTFSAFRMGSYSRWVLILRLGAYSNKYGTFLTLPL